jgi:hypothetical protein
MGRRNRAIWGWTEEEWIEVVECRRYDGNRIIAAAFLLRGGFAALSRFPKGRQVYSCLVCRVFGFKAVTETERQVKAGLRDLGYRARTLRIMPLTLAQLLLIVRSPRLEDITESALLQLQEQNGTVALEQCVIAMSRLLISKGIIENPIRRLGLRPVLMVEAPEVILANVPVEWARLARYWHDTSTLTPNCWLRHYYRILTVGRWMQATHPQITSPAEWTRSMAAEAVAMFLQQKSGEWTHRRAEEVRNSGRPMAVNTRIQSLYTLRRFFSDLQQWDIIPRRFDPYNAFRVPRSVQALVERNPRVLADDVWAKLIWAGLNLSAADLSVQGGGSHYYPLPLVRALSVVWLFSGLHWEEIRRLRLGCIRWQQDVPGERVCLLSVPVNKTNTAFTKPVDTIVGETIENWKRSVPHKRNSPIPKPASRSITCLRIVPKHWAVVENQNFG